MNETSDKKEYISDYILGNNRIILLFQNRICSYSMQDGGLINEKIIPSGITGNLNAFCTDQYYVQTDSLFQSIELTDPDKMYVITDSMNLLTLNDQFEVLNTVRSSELYSLFLKMDNYKFLNRNNTTIIINKENKKIAELKTSANATLIGQKLYDIQDKSLLEFDLADLLSENSPKIHFENLTSKQAFEMIQKHEEDSAFVILDVRTPEEYQSGHIENAILLDFKSPDFREKISALG